MGLCVRASARLRASVRDIPPSSVRARLSGGATTEQHGKAAFVLLFQQVQSAAGGRKEEGGVGRR